MSDQEALEAEEQISERVAEEASQADEAPAADEDLEAVSYTHLTLPTTSRV